MASSIKERVREAVKRGEEEAKKAHEILEIAKKAGLEFPEQETKLAELEEKLAQIKEAVKK